MVTTSLALATLPASAEQIMCTMGSNIPLSFVIDHTHFATAVDPDEPPRQARSQVTFGDRTFSAAPFVLGNTRGFEVAGLDRTTMLFVMRPDGTARLSDVQADLRMTGTCTVLETEQ